MRRTVRLWTAKGIERLGAECTALEQKAREQVSDLQADRAPGLYCTDGMLLEKIGATAEYKMTVGILEEKQALLASLVIASKPKHNRWVQIGHLVRIRRDDDSIREFVLGGDGESYPASPHYPRIASCTAPLGKAVLRQRVGDEGFVDVQGASYGFEIEKISLPKKTILGKEPTSAKKSGRQIPPKGFGAVSMHA